MEASEIRQKIIEKVKIEAHEELIIADHDPSWVLDELQILSDVKLKKGAKKRVKENLEALSEAQELLAANDTYSLLLVFQAMDAAGKDGTIKHVMSGLNPQGFQVFSFKKPSAEELDHNFLWRYTKSLPERGRIGIFNRSYYEEVLVVKVHPKILDGQKLPEGMNYDQAFWDGRYDDINQLENHLHRNGTIVLKFFLNVSKEEQKNRFIERLSNPEKHWKFSENDLVERGFWDDYMKAFEEAITKTSTDWAPWYVIPADHKWVMRAIVSYIITETILSLNMKFPEVTEEKESKTGRSLEKITIRISEPLNGKLQAESLELLTLKGKLHFTKN